MGKSYFFFRSGTMGEMTLCYGCMENKHAADAICPKCKYAVGASHLPTDIEPGTLLHNRYVVGIRLSANGEGITYIGYDTVISCKVIIREYMPSSLCTRVEGKPTISVNYNNLAQYKAVMAEFTELNKTLAQMRSLKHISPAMDLFSEFNTTYAIFEYFNCMTFIDFLKENAGELPWETVSMMFPTLLTSLSALHTAGVIHRGISPDSLYYLPNGGLKLQNFCVSSVRMANAELESELFKGYAAPEQYLSNEKQGTWTDVYGICATFYRILIGVSPPDAQSRLDNDTLNAPHEINPNVPVNVSRAIMDGMNIDRLQRIKTIDALESRLFDVSHEDLPLGDVANGSASGFSGLDDGTVAFDPSANSVNNGPQIAKPQTAPPVKPPQKDKSYWNQYDEYEIVDEGTEVIKVKKDDNLDRIKLAVVVGVLIIAVGMIIIALVMSALPNGDTDVPLVSTPSASATNPNGNYASQEPLPSVEGDTDMPNLESRDFELQRNYFKNIFVLEAEYEFSETVPKGIIIAQPIPEGEKVRSGQVIKVRVSKGSEYITVPAYSGKNITQYLAILEELGLTADKYELKPLINYNFENGYITSVKTESGSSRIKLSGADKVWVYYVDNPLESTPAPTETTPAEQQTDAPATPAVTAEE
jgi:serine/threonine-protein kinase